MKEAYSFKINTSIDGWPIEENGKAMSKKETTLRLNEQEKTISDLFGLLEKIKSIASDLIDFELLTEFEDRLGIYADNTKSDEYNTKVDQITRAFWRRIDMYKSDYSKELPRPLPIEFKCAMMTALSLLDLEKVMEIQKEQHNDGLVRLETSCGVVVYI